MDGVSGRTAIVTGASRGIGAGIARALGDAGADVVVNFSRDEAGAQKVVEANVDAGGRAVAVQADVSDPGDVNRLFASAHESFGPVDILVNNAGVYAFGPFQAVDVAEFHRQVDTNLLGPLLTMQAFAEQAGDEGGAIINISTAGVSSLPPYTALYTASKSALNALTLVVAKELAPRGIRVNAIAASATDTEGTREMGFVGSEAAAQTAAQIPLGRLGRPDDIAPVAVFLASRAAAWITGEVVYASGGQR